MSIRPEFFPGLFIVGALLLAGQAHGDQTPPPAPVSAAPTHAAAPPAKPSPPRKATPQERAEADRMDPLARATFWGREADIDPRDPQSGVKLAKALRELGRYDEAETASAHVLVVAPANLEALLENARDYLAAGQGFYAIEPAKRAAAVARDDWRPKSLLGVALEQSKRDDEALAAFKEALALAPANPATLSNLALFDAAHGQTAQAEILLRQAVAAPGAGARERQNLALILGLSGRLAEAEHLQRQDLPPETVANDLAYLRDDQGGRAARSWGALASQQ